MEVGTAHADGSHTGTADGSHTGIGRRAMGPIQGMGDDRNSGRRRHPQRGRRLNETHRLNRLRIQPFNIDALGRHVGVVRTYQDVEGKGIP